jgi:hypothetical protein
MNQAETAANNFGIRGLPDAIWLQLEQAREVPLAPEQTDLEDFMSAAKPAPIGAPRRRNRHLRRRELVAGAFSRKA